MTPSHTPSPIVPIQYTVGDVTTFTARPAVIARLCPDRGAWTHGVAAAISRQWPHTARDHRDPVRDKSRRSGRGRITRTA